MDTNTDYTNFNEIDFAGDEFFQDWVLRPSPEAMEYWSDFLSAHPDKKELLENARNLVQSIKFKEEWPDDKLVENSLQRSLEIIDDRERAARRSISFARWLAAAAILFAIAAGGYFLLNQYGNHPVNTADKKTNHDIAPGGNKAILTLADGSTIVLDSAQNGMLSQQGNAKVVKLQDGKVAYDQLAISNKQLAIQYNTITTPRGGQYQLTLADGSRVWLNAASSITFPTAFTGDTRDVNITGEAYFEVAHDASRPFHVKVNKMDIEVLGTHFNVNAYEDEGEIKTTLLQGSVKVAAGKNAVILKPGQQADLQPSTFNLKTTNDVNLVEVMAWKNGLFYFNEASIREIMKKISRWYDVDIEIGSEVPDTKFNGKIYRNVNASEVFKILEEGGIHINIIGKRVIVTK